MLHGYGREHNGYQSLLATMTGFHRYVHRQIDWQGSLNNLD
jgi:hypothetical protein